MTWGDIERAENGATEGEEEMRPRRRIIIAPDDRESTAIISVALPPGGMMELDPANWRFEGWLTERVMGACTCGESHPALMLEEPKLYHGDADADG